MSVTPKVHHSREGEGGREGGREGETDLESFLQTCVVVALVAHHYDPQILLHCLIYNTIMSEMK